MLLRTILALILNIAFIFSAKQGVASPPINSVTLHRQNSNINLSKSYSQFINANRDDLILWQDDFESGGNGWSFDAGWKITETSSNSPTHSVVSPNDNSTLNGSFNLVTPSLELSEIGVDETMHFGFWIHSDIPDFDGDDDGYLDDYYSISISGIGESAWHSDDFNSYDGNNFWCSDESLNGYLDGWIQYLDTPTITIGVGGELTARIYYAIEDSEGAAGGVEGSCTDGWDAANIRISNDGGTTWLLLEDNVHPYHFECGYGWIYNDDEYELGNTLNHLAKGWSGESGSWLDFYADLSEFANEEVIIRFAFGSDPAYSTADDGNGNPVPSLTGFQVDDISVRDNFGLLFSDSGDDMSQMVAGGEVWKDQFYDYGSVDEGRPGASGWEEYAPGLPFNGNTFLNISEFAGKTIKLRIQSRYDDDNDGGQGGGLYVDDFIVYKLSTGAYFAPWGLEVEAGDGEVSLSWGDMNAAGTDNFIYESGIFSSDNIISTVAGNGWAGVLFDVIGQAQINSFSFYNMQGDTTIDIEVYGMFGSTIDTEPKYALEVDIINGWNEFSVNDWKIENYFVIAHEINSDFGVALDTNQTTLHSFLRLGGTWDFALNYNILGDFGIRANITYEGAGVSYNLYRDALLIKEGLAVNSYTDNDVVNNTTYEYSISATYDDGEESSQSSSIVATPLSITIHQESYDDGTYESEYTAGAGNFSAVKYSANVLGESIMRFKWYQIGSGGAFYIKVFADDNGVPGMELFSTVQAVGNEDGWNEKDLSGEGIIVNGDFWVGTKEFSSSKPFGLDIDSISYNSFENKGNGWSLVSGNLGYRCFLNSEILSNEKKIYPQRFRINQIHPNPFNPITNIHFEVVEFSQIKLSIVDLNGRLVSVLENEAMNPGQYQYMWDGNNSYGNQVSSGIYLAVLESNDMLMQTRKLILLK